MLGSTQSEIKCGVSLGLEATPQVLLERVAVELRAGYQRIKLKIKPGKDLEVGRAVRNANPGILLSVDANSAYTPVELEHLKRFDEFNLLMMEQPLWWDDIANHAKLQRHLKTSLCLDESIRHVRDAETALDLGAARIINIKVGRVGATPAPARSSLSASPATFQFGAAACSSAVSAALTTSRSLLCPATRCPAMFPLANAIGKRTSSTRQSKYRPVARFRSPPRLDSAIMFAAT